MSKSNDTQMESSIRSQDEPEYYRNSLILASALMNLIPADEKLQVEKWFKKLYTSDPNEIRLCLDYLWFLLVQLENGRITLPFISDPPNGRLPPLRSTVDTSAYKDILTTSNRSTYHEEMTKTFNNTNNQTGKSNKQNDEPKYERPSNFLKNLPVPVRGFIFYGSCFSNQDD